MINPHIEAVYWLPQFRKQKIRGVICNTTRTVTLFPAEAPVKGRLAWVDGYHVIVKPKPEYAR